MLKNTPLPPPQPIYSYYCLYCPPCRRCRKRKTFALYFPMANFYIKSREYLLRYIVYRAVLPFTQLREVSYRSRMRGGRRCWTWKYPIATTAPTNLNMMIIVFLIAPLVLSTTPNTDDPPGEHHPWMHLRDHLKSRMHICLVPHNACQWLSRELASLEKLSQSEVRKRSGTNVGIRCCYFAKLKH